MAQRADALRDLVLVLLALKTGELDREALSAAFGSWDCAGDRPLVDVLLTQGALNESQFSSLERRVGEHLRTASGDLSADVPTIGVEGAGTDLTDVTLPGVPEQTPTLADDGLTLPAVAGPDLGNPSAVADFTVHSVPGDVRFKELRYLAEGGLGVVWVALDTELNREVALKRIQERYADHVGARHRFIVEAKVTGGLEHPGIVPVYGLGARADGRPYYAMRLIKGDSLKDAVDAFHANETFKHDPGARGLAFRKLLRRFLDVCNTIEYAHGRGVYHRDIKPANVMVGKYGETLVVDWGIAKTVGMTAAMASTDGGVEQPLEPTSVTGSTETLPGSAMGTLAFMSPEQARGEHDRLTPASDVYSLGATLYYLLTGKLAFGDGELGALLRAVKEGAFPPPGQVDRSVDRSLEAVCLKAMSREPGDRYASARALADDIERWAADEPVSARTEPFPERARRWMRRRRTLVVSAAAALLVATVGLAALLASQTRHNAELRLANQREHDRFNLAVDAIRTFHTGISEDFLLRESQFNDLRNKLLDKPRNFYKLLREQLRDETDPQSREALGKALYDLGELTSKIGIRPEALKAHNEGLAIRRELAAAADATAERGADVGRSLLAIGRIEVEVGRRPEAESHFLAARDCLESLARGHTDRPRIAADLATASDELGKLFSSTNGRRDEALAAFARARLIWEELAKSGDLEARRKLAGSLYWLASLLEAGGSKDKALETYERASSLRRELIESYDRYATMKPVLTDSLPTKNDLRADLAASDNSIGAFYQRHNRMDEALGAYRRSLESRRALAGENPAVTDLQINLARTYHNIATLQAGLGRIDDALSNYRAAVDIDSRLVRANPRVPKFQAALAAVSSDMGGWLYRKGQTAEALAAFQRSRSMEMALVGSDKTVTLYPRNLALSNQSIGIVLTDEGRTTEALLYFREARQSLQELVRDNPETLELSHFLSGVDIDIGRALLASGRPDEALEAYGQARAILLELVDKNHDARLYNLHLADCETAIGKLKADAGDRETAASFFDRSKRRLIALLQRESKASEEKASLATTEEAIANLLSAEGKLGDGLKANANARRFWESLAETNPDVGDHVAALASNAGARGGIYKRARLPGPALTAFNEALEKAEKVTHENPTIPRFQVLLAEIEVNRGALLSRMNHAAAATTALLLAVRVLDGLDHLGPGDRLLLAKAHALLSGQASIEGSGLSLADVDAESEKAIAALARAVLEGFRDRRALETDPDLDTVRPLPAFRGLIGDLDFPIDPFQFGPAWE